jgi:hypothetical protein
MGVFWIRAADSREERLPSRFHEALLGLRRPACFWRNFPSAGLFSMEPAGIEPATSWLQSSFADALREARKQRESRKTGLERVRRMSRDWGGFRGIKALDDRGSA